MDVLAVSTWYPNDSAPVMGVFVEKDVHLLAQDHHVEVVHLVAPRLYDGGPATVERDGVTVHRIVMSTQRPDHVLRARRALEPFLSGADLVHSMAFSSLLPFAGRRPDQPWVHTEHWSGVSDPASLPLTWRAMMPALRRLLAAPDVVTAVCERLARPVRAVRERPTRVVPCIVPVPEPVPARPLRSGLLRLVAVGGLVEGKAPLLAVETLAALRSRGCDAELSWVGDGPLRTRVAEEARRLGLEQRVRLLGVRDTAGVSAALADADLFLLPTRAENFCVSAAEALVHGRPVVVGANGGQAEYVRPEAGELVPLQEAGAYAEAVIAVDERTRGLDAETVAATVGDRFSPETVRRGYAAAYEVAVRSAGSGRP